MKKRLIPVSPPHLIDTIIISLMLLISIVFIIIFHIRIRDSYFWAFYISWAVFAIILSGVAVLSYRGIIVTKIDNIKIASSLLKKKCCEMNFQDIQYVSFVSSFNYGLDIKASYIVLSNEPIKGKNLAVSFSPKTQIVIRVSSKNYPMVKEWLLPLPIQQHLPYDFKRFQEGIYRNHNAVNLKKVENEFKIVYMK